MKYGRIRAKSSDEVDIVPNKITKKSWIINQIYISKKYMYDSLDQQSPRLRFHSLDLAKELQCLTGSRSLSFSHYVSIY